MYTEGTRKIQAISFTTHLPFAIVTAYLQTQPRNAKQQGERPETEQTESPPKNSENASADGDFRPDTAAPALYSPEPGKCASAEAVTPEIVMNATETVYAAAEAPSPNQKNASSKNKKKNKKKRGRKKSRGKKPQSNRVGSVVAVSSPALHGSPVQSMDL